MFTTPTLHREFFHVQTPNMGVVLDPGVHRDQAVTTSPCGSDTLVRGDRQLQEATDHHGQDSIIDSIMRATFLRRHPRSE